MTKLNAVNIGMNKFCGPAVLSILTGKSTDECARVISSVNGQYKVEGVQLNDLLRAADKLGFDQIPISPSGSLFSTLTRLVTDDGMYIVTVPSHFIAIEVSEKKIYFCDNHTKEPMPAAASARLLQKVLAVHQVIKRREPVKIGSRIHVEKKVYDWCIQINVKRELTFDMPEHNKASIISCISLENEEEYEEFTSQVNFIFERGRDE
jgi:hypothetical protein